ARGWTLLEGEQHFSDVPAGSAFHPYVETAYMHGIINGYTDGTFRPQSPATRGQIAKIVDLALTGDR
ncbi:MAG TPA: S-layer homology domain-containing protein, partial [Chloroflexia bacterium]|nr:S-layer homology domain-containing protein [Chloroflexia bacterium]